MFIFLIGFGNVWGKRDPSSFFSLCNNNSVFVYSLLPCSCITILCVTMYFQRNCFRYTIVLQIFKIRAQTKEAKLQVALAELLYFRYVNTTILKD